MKTQPVYTKSFYDSTTKLASSLTWGKTESWQAVIMNYKYYETYIAILQKNKHVWILNAIYS